MMLSRKQKLVLLFPPALALGLLAAVYVYIEYVFGNLSWLFPVGDGPIPPNCELVLTPGMKITVLTDFGEVQILAGRGLKRSLTWSGATRSIELIPRPERWNGSLGGYFPGSGYHWWPNHGIRRCVFDEGQLNFSSAAEALKFLKSRRRFYRSDGFSIELYKSESTLGVDIDQLYINGKKPSGLPGAADNRIRFDAGGPTAVSTSAPADSEFTSNDASYRAEKKAAECFYDVFFGMGEEFFAEHQYRDALNCYADAVFARPSAHIHLRMARCYFALGENKKTVEHCDAALKFEPHNEEIKKLRKEAEEQ